MSESIHSMAQQCPDRMKCSEAQLATRQVRPPMTFPAPRDVATVPTTFLQFATKA